MIPQLKGIKPLGGNHGGNGRIARLEKTVDALVKFLSNIETGLGIKFEPTKDISSIRIMADTDADNSFALPPGEMDNQVLKWDAKAGAWVPGWVTAVDPNASADDPSDGEYKVQGDEDGTFME